MPLAEDEISEMLSWLQHLDPVYPEALEIAVQMPPAAMDNTYVLNHITERGLHESFPEPVAELLDYLSRCELSHALWHESTGLINQLRQSDISNALKSRLHEILVKFRLQ